MTKEELEQKKAELDREFNWKQELLEVIPEGIKYITFESNGKWLVSFDDLKAEDFNTILNAFPENKNEITEIKSASGVLGHIDSPFRLEFENPCSPVYGDLKISYHSMAVEIWMKFPFTEVQDILEGHAQKTQRRITSSEHHYFTGYSRRRLDQVRVPQLEWTHAQQSWYGGKKTLMDSLVVEEIITKFKNQ